MPDELALSTVGIKRPATRMTAQPSIGSVHGEERNRRPALRVVKAPPDVRPRRVLNPSPIIADPDNVPELTTVRLDGDLARKLDRTARAAGVSANQLALAALEQALSAGHREMHISDRRARTDTSTTRPKLRVPDHLRAKADAVRARTTDPRASRSGLINAAIRRGLPDDPRMALAVVIVAATATRARKS